MKHLLAVLLLLLPASLSLAQRGDGYARCFNLSSDNGTTTTCICQDPTPGDRLFHDVNCNRVKDGGDEWLDNAAGASTVWTDADPIAPQTTTRDIHLGDSAGTLVGTLEVGGDTDQPQVVIEGHSTQTDSLLICQNDADTELFSVSPTGSIFITEKADADAAVASHGQIWVNTATPNELWFTDDAGTDTQLGVGGSETNDLESIATSAGDAEIFVGTGVDAGAYIAGLAPCAADEKPEYTPGSPDTLGCEAIGGLVDADVSDTLTASNINSTAVTGNASNLAVMFGTGVNTAGWDTTPAIDCTDCTNTPAGSHTGTIIWGGTAILESGIAFQFGDTTDATLTHTYANTGTNVDIAYSTGAMAVTGTLTATNLSGTNTGDDDVPESGDFGALAGGTGITFSDPTISFAPAEVATVTWLDNADRDWTFDIAAAGTNPEIHFAADEIELDANVQVDDGKELRLMEPSGAGTNYITIVAPATIAANRTCTLEDDSTPFDGCITSGGGMTSWNLDGDNTSPQIISNDNTALIAGTAPISTVASATDTVTVSLDGDGVNATHIDETAVYAWSGASTHTNATISGGDSGATTTRPAGSNIVSARTHNTDCTTLTDGKLGEICADEDDGKMFVCVPSAGDCSGAEWLRLDADSGGAPAFSAVTTGTNTEAGGLFVGTGGSLSATGTGTIVATGVDAVGAAAIAIGSADVTEITILSDGLTSSIVEAELDIISDGAIALASEVSGILPGANGGTNNGFMDFTGPATSLKTFTLPNATSTILTDNADVTVAQGGTGVSTLTDGQYVVGQGTAAVKAITPWFGTVRDDPADADSFDLFKSPAAITITDIHCITDAGTVVVDIQQCSATGTTCASVDTTISCDSDGAEDDGTLSNAAIAATDWVLLDIGTVTTASQVAITVYYTVD